MKCDGRRMPYNKRMDMHEDWNSDVDKYKWGINFWQSIDNAEIDLVIHYCKYTPYINLYLYVEAWLVNLSTDGTTFFLKWFVWVGYSLLIHYIQTS